MAKGNRHIPDSRNSALAEALERARIEEGFSQQRLATRLKTSQGTICKILQKRQLPQPALEKRIRDFLGPRWPVYGIGSDEWIQQVKAAAEKSSEFAALLTSALMLLGSNTNYNE
jgi:transcriptional regulator with XRE-family HTH domain